MHTRSPQTLKKMRSFFTFLNHLFLLLSKRFDRIVFGLLAARMGTSVFGRILCSLQTKSQSNDVYCKKHRPEEQEHDKDYGNGLAPVEPEDQILEDAKMA